jgi:hypothetical protein
VRAEQLGPRGKSEKIALVALARYAGPHFLEAGTAVDGAVQPRHEGHEGLAATHGADDSAHLSAVARRPFPPACCPAGGTTLRLVEQALLQVEALLASGEDELHPTITACYGLVFQGQSRSPPLPGFLAPLDGPPGGRAARADDRRDHSSTHDLVGREDPAVANSAVRDCPASEDRCKLRPGHGRKYRPALRQKSRE